ncbi:MAG TPA: peptidoglycan-associated lipoprotein Pal [Burkholderiaceae bacterium]|jgi:peptidoglycan-associated lipoprotein|nr:peptidoglycan-associated lipoprotein Pal [Burkholderiaceae bacterium]
MTSNSRDSISRTAALALALAVVAGCASKVPLNPPPPVETRSSSNAPPPASAESQITPIDQTQGQALTGSNLPRVIYFDFDSYVVKSDFRPIIEQHAALLKANKTRREVAEGHTDERGGSEYNLALGQKRAEAVVQQLVLLGATDAQLEAVSYGAERPAVEGHDESAWVKNRRVELRDK